MSARVAILTVSDTAALDPALDISGKVIKDFIDTHGLICDTTTIVRDDEATIKQVVIQWCERGNINFVVTTGGTGFGTRDRTPEAILPLIERHAPGIVHLLIKSALQHTPFGALSRPVAGTIKNTLIVTLPGSPKAVKECLDALFDGGVIQHAIDLINGGSGKKVHHELGLPDRTKTQSTPSHVHKDHHHDHTHHAPKPRTMLSHDPSLPASARHRVSPYPLVPLNDAITMVLRETQTLEVVNKLVGPSLRECVVAEDVFASQDMPLSHSTNVDGYALRSSDPPGTYQVVTPVTHPLSSLLPSGCIYRINTGSPLPGGADAVIMVEDTRLMSASKVPGQEEEEETEVATLVSVHSGENIRAPGSDVRKGDKVLPRGEILGSGGGEIGTLAFVGRKEVNVYRKPIVAILSTGNEITDLYSPRQQESEGWGGIWDTNRPILHAALDGLGYDVIDLGVVTDDISAHLQAMRTGLSKADVLVTTGGSSMGSSDLLKPLIERHLNGTIHFGRVAVKPGKPTAFATIPVNSGLATKKAVFALPGNPASALVTFYLFVLPALRKLGGWPESRCRLPKVKVTLASAMPLDPRPEFHRVVIKASSNGLTAYSTGGQRSSRAVSLSGANGLVALPARSEGGKNKLEKGDIVEAVLIGEIQME